MDWRRHLTYPPVLALDSCFCKVKQVTSTIDRPPPPELDASLLQVPHSILSFCLFSLPGTQLYTGYTPGWRKALQCFSWDSVLCDNTQKPQPVISFFSAGEISWHLALSYILEIITSFFCSIFFCPKQCLGIN